ACDHRLISQVANEFWLFRPAATQVIEWLPQPEIPAPHLLQNFQRVRKLFPLPDLGKPGSRFGHGQLEHIVNRFSLQLNFEHVRLESFAFAFRTTDIKIAQKLHLDFLETGAIATLTTAGPRIKGKCTGGYSLRLRFRQDREELAHAIIKPEI